MSSEDLLVGAKILVTMRVSPRVLLIWLDSSPTVVNRIVGSSSRVGARVATDGAVSCVDADADDECSDQESGAIIGSTNDATMTARRIWSGKTDGSVCDAALVVGGFCRVRT